MAEFREVFSDPPCECNQPKSAEYHTNQNLTYYHVFRYAYLQWAERGDKRHFLAECNCGKYVVSDEPVRDSGVIYDTLLEMGWKLSEASHHWYCAECAKEANRHRIKRRSPKGAIPLPLGLTYPPALTY